MATAAEDNDVSNGQRLLTYRVDRVEETIDEIRDAIKSIDSSLQGFAMVQSQYAATRAVLKRASSSIEALEKRLQAVEMELPTLKLVRNWVIGGVLSVVGTVGSAVVALVLR